MMADLLDAYVSEGRIEPEDAESLRDWIGARIAAAVRESAADPCGECRHTSHDGTCHALLTQPGDDPRNGPDYCLCNPAATDEYPVLNATKGTTLVFPDGSTVIVTTQNGRYILADHMDVVP